MALQIRMHILTMPCRYEIVVQQIEPKTGIFLCLFIFQESIIYLRDQENIKLPVINCYIQNYIDIATIKNGILENTKSLNCYRV